MTQEEAIKNAAEEIKEKMFEALSCYSDGNIRDCDCSKDCILTASDVANYAESIITSHLAAVDNAEEYPVKAAKRMAKYLLNSIEDCPLWEEHWEREGCKTMCPQNEEACWLQYFKEKEEENS